MKVALTVIKGPGAGQVREFVEPRGFLIGRAADCDFRLPPNDPYVSRHHVYLEICPPACRVRDLGAEGAGSTNRPRLNGQPVTEADLAEGDVLELGYTQFRIGITLDKPQPLSRKCSECGNRIEYWPDERVPERCADCRDRGRPALALKRVSVHCAECRCDLSAKANSDGRADDLAAVASYCCERCLSKLGGLAGKTIQSYQVIKPLGAGGMGSVSLVYDADTGRLWALKQMKDLKDAELAKRFERGMRLHKGVTHQNIVRCVETGVDANGQPYVVTEYVPGGELGETVDAGTRLRPDVAVPLVCGVLDGLEHLHALQIIHRDLKPPNILLDRKLFDAKGAATRPLPTPKIADFDLAKRYGLAGGTRITKLGTGMGTLMYMPPEQVRSAATIKEPADIYATGVVLYYLLTGRYTFNFPTPAEIREVQRQDPGAWKGPQEALRMIMKLERIQHPFRIILSEEPIPVRQRDASIPDRLALVVDHAVKKDPAERFQSAAQFRDALRGAL